MNKQHDLKCIFCDRALELKGESFSNQYCQYYTCSLDDFLILPINNPIDKYGEDSFGNKLVVVEVYENAGAVVYRVFARHMYYLVYSTKVSFSQLLGYHYDKIEAIKIADILGLNTRWDRIEI